MVAAVAFAAECHPVVIPPCAGSTGNAWRAPTEHCSGTRSAARHCAVASQAHAERRMLRQRPALKPLGGTGLAVPSEAVRMRRPACHELAENLDVALVPEVGIEPTRPFGHGILSPARLPVSPLRRRGGIVSIARDRGVRRSAARVSTQTGRWRPCAIPADQGARQTAIFAVRKSCHANSVPRTRLRTLPFGNQWAQICPTPCAPTGFARQTATKLRVQGRSGLSRPDGQQGGETHRKVACFRGFLIVGLCRFGYTE